MNCILLNIKSREDLNRAADAFKRAELGERNRITFAYHDTWFYSYPGTLSVHLPLMGDAASFLSDVDGLIVH